MLRSGVACETCRCLVVSNHARIIRAETTSGELLVRNI